MIDAVRRGCSGPYPFAAYTVVVTDDELEIPLEAQGLSIFGANHLDGRLGRERLVAHELAHQWFGNSLTLGRWRDIWLHEGFACYAEWLWSEESRRAVGRRHARRGTTRGSRPLPQDLVLGDPGPELMFDDRVYKRGALTLHALRLTVGDDAFFDALRAWTGRTPTAPSPPRNSSTSRPGTATHRCASSFTPGCAGRRCRTCRSCRAGGPGARRLSVRGRERGRRRLQPHARRAALPCRRRGRLLRSPVP